MNISRIGINDFWRGVIVGVVASAIIVGVGLWLAHLNKREKEILQYAEKQIEIEAMREDIINRPADEFFEIPGVRRTADGARDEFDRKRDEALQRFRDRHFD